MEILNHMIVFLGHVICKQLVLRHTKSQALFQKIVCKALGFNFYSKYQTLRKKQNLSYLTSPFPIKYTV